MSTRKAIHAGSWYSDSRSVLQSELEGWLSKATISHSPARAIIAPKRVFILGPSHHVYLSGCALSPTTHYETPLYNLTIDQAVYAELFSTGIFEHMSQTVDEEEHSIEMHLPFIAKVMESRRDKFTIVPVLVGALREGREIEYGHVFSRYIADPHNLFVVSSDFCHWGSRFKYTYYNKEDGPIHKSIENLDRCGMAKIETMDPRAFSTYLQETHNTICGRHPIAVLLNAVSKLQSTERGLHCELKFVRYAQSNQCHKSSDSSVSYASASLTVSTAAD